MLELLKNLDRRWIYLMMALAVAIPIIVLNLTKTTFPEKPTVIVQTVFDMIEQLPSGSRVMVAMDFDPSSAGELAPMATAITRHLMEKRHKIYFLSLWPLGPQMTENALRKVLVPELGWEPQYGVDYVDLGFKTGNEGVVKVIASDLRKAYPTDKNGTNLDDLPITRDVKNLTDMNMIFTVSAGYPGIHEWIIYAATPLGVPTAGGVTGVTAPQMYPYYPNQLKGLLGAIKGAAEYEAALSAIYTKYDDPKDNEGLRRMGPQLVAHILMVVLIVTGNLIFFIERRRGGAR